MLKRANRLSLERDIARARSKGVTRRGYLFTFRYFLRQEGGNPRFCFVVSKKLSKRAVDRNRVVRWAREAVMDALPQISVAGDVLLTAQKRFEDYSYVRVKEEIENLFKEIGFIKK